jgi:hypothetical protein
MPRVTHSENFIILVYSKIILWLKYSLMSSSTNEMSIIQCIGLYEVILLDHLMKHKNVIWRKRIIKTSAMASARLYLKGLTKAMRFCKSDGCHLLYFIPGRERRSKVFCLFVSQTRLRLTLFPHPNVRRWHYRLSAEGRKLYMTLRRRLHSWVSYSTKSLKSVSIRRRQCGMSILNAQKDKLMLEIRYISWSKHWGNKFPTSTRRVLEYQENVLSMNPWTKSIPQLSLGFHW